MNKKNKYWKLKQLLLDLFFFLVLLALDQGTKYLAVTHLVYLNCSIWKTEEQHSVFCRMVNCFSCLRRS